MSNSCAIWQSETTNSNQTPNWEIFDSPRAGGLYKLTRRVKGEIHSLTEAQKATLTTWLINQRAAGNSEPQVTEADVNRAKTAPSLSIAQRRDGLLKAVARHTPDIGGAMRYRDPIHGVDGQKDPLWAAKDYLLAATESIRKDEVEKLIEFANKQGLLVSSASKLSLTFEGYAHLEALASVNQDSHQAFVAMWFNAEVADVYEKAMVPAIIATGYSPLRIDQKEHNNKIDDEIIAEIRRSKFVVADFTCGFVEREGSLTAIPRGGVYYEAGFAQGMGIPVIWCCREDHIDHVHFDTRQFNHITWKTPEDLRVKLLNRIGAVLGDGPLLTNR